MTEEGGPGNGSGMQPRMQSPSRVQTRSTSTGVEPSPPSPGSGPARFVHCLTFDVEEHFQVAAFDSPMRRRHWDQFESRVEANTMKVLDMLTARDVRATFFVLGWVAQRHKALIKAIAKAGHEVASHGYAHELVMSQNASTFREDVRKTKQILEDLVGTPVSGYRAPTFSITEETSWALQILVEEGYEYDSSIYPVLHDYYGWRGANPRVHRIETRAGSIWEIPPSTVTVAGKQVPIGGGGYLRVMPFWLLRRWMRHVERGGHPLVIYVHPWELDPEQPRMNGSLVSEFRHYANLHKTEARLLRLLHEFQFGPILKLLPGCDENRPYHTGSDQQHGQSNPCGNICP